MASDTSDVPVGTVRVRGMSRVQKQRDGSWLRLGKARPGEGNPPKRKNALRLPMTAKRSPVVKPVAIPVGQKWREAALDMPESTLDDMFERPGDEKPQTFGQDPSAFPQTQPTPPSPEPKDPKDDEPKPKPQRKALHERIFRTFLDHVDPVDFERMPVAVLMTGGPLSGRTSVVKSLSHEATFVRVDPETIGTMIPEYEESIKKYARNAPTVVVEEAAFIAFKLLEKAVEDRKNVVIDAIGVDADAHAELLESLEDAGYFTVVILTDVDRSDALERNKVRGAKMGRWAPREAIALVKDAAETFEELEDEANETLRLDTRKAPKHVVETFEDLAELFEDDPDPDGPDVPDISLKEIRKLALEGLRRDRNLLDALPDRYKPSEGVILAHYVDLHIRPIQLEDEESEDDPDDGSEEG